MKDDTTLRCKNCNKWVGEAAVPMVPVDHVKSGHEATIEPPRDLRLCSSCKRVTIYVPRAGLDTRRTSAVGLG